MSFIADNPLIFPEIESYPSAPKSRTRAIFAGKDGFYVIDSNSNIKKIPIDALTYKGSLYDTSKLPTNPLKGDIYNIKTESNITVKGEGRTKYLIPCSGSIDSRGEFYSQYDAMYDSWLNQPSELELFDNDGNSLGIGSSVICFDGTVLVQGSGLEEGTQISYIQLPNQEDNENALGEAVTVYEAIELPIMPKQKVFYNGTEWDVFAGDLSRFAMKENYYTAKEIDSKLSAFYRYKGTKTNFTDLPTSGNTIGDVWNIENEYMLSKMVYPITVIGTDDSYLNEVGWLLLNCNDETFPAEVQESSVTIYDSTGKKIGTGYIPYGSSSSIQAYVTTLESGNYYVEFSPDLADYNTKELIVMKIDPGDNVAWTGSEWDRLAGTIDLSDYVTKEELGNIETALDSIIAIENALIGGDSV